jgi:hypothetical protein
MGLYITIRHFKTAPVTDEAHALKAKKQKAESGCFQGLSANSGFNSENRVEGVKATKGLIKHIV